MSEIKIVKIGNTSYEIAAKYLKDSGGNLKSWEDITSLIEKGLVMTVLDSLPTADASAYTTYQNTLVFIKNGSSGSSIYNEYIIQRNGTEGSYTYRWELIGSTEVDLTNYVQKGVTYTAAALSNGGHKHTVTIPTVNVTSTLKLGATASGTAIGASTTDQVVKSYPGTTSKLVTTSVSKATAGTQMAFNTDAIKSAILNTSSSQSTGSIAYVSAVTNPTLDTTEGKTTFITSVSDQTLTGQTEFVILPTVDSNGTLSFETGTVKISTASKQTGTVKLNPGTITTKYMSTSTEAASTDNITPYTFTDVSVATGALSTTATGASVLTGLGTPTTATAITGVKVTAQPTITITESSSNTGPVNEHVEVDTATQSTTTDGAHTHNIKVSE